MLGAIRKPDRAMVSQQGVGMLPSSQMPEAKKYSVAVTAHSTYLPDQSDEEEDRYVFAYTIRITNNGSVPAQLVSRHWIITDADNQVQEVRGMGVVGEQPVLKPGDTFEYSSGSSIPTAVGTMRGRYQLVAADGTRVEANTPALTPSVPRTRHRAPTARSRGRVHGRPPATARGRPDAGHLPAGRRGRHAVRGQHPGIHAERPAHAALSAQRSSSSSRSRDLRGRVHQTISTAIARASPISRNTQPTPASIPVLRAIPLSSIAARAFAVAIAGAAAGCATTPPPAPPAVAAAPTALICPPVEKPGCPAPPTTPATPPAPTPAVEYRGRLQPASWIDLPAWKGEPVRPALEAFLRGCPVLEKQDAWKEVCAGAQSVLSGGGEREAAAFFELNFEPHQVINADESTAGMVTGYYEPLLPRSRSRTARYRYPLYAPAPDVRVTDVA